MAAAHHRRERAAKLLGHRTSDLLAQLLETPQRTGECSDVDHGDADSMAPELQIGAGKRTLPKRERKHTHRTEQRLQEHSWEKQAKHVQRSQQYAVALRKARKQQEEKHKPAKAEQERVGKQQR